eukprot:TRINITY_DN9270_c0_g1_i1.p1 TRINITY_DN9270_c0_g1~~TRINITY_DN9270_c0_g1_i1.p1  ORF type:complete len:204 (+),score=61.18 TRINITY_DN9270_c0_g1_i1:66-677(+)
MCIRDRGYSLSTGFPECYKNLRLIVNSGVTTLTFVKLGQVNGDIATLDNTIKSIGEIEKNCEAWFKELNTVVNARSALKAFRDDIKGTAKEIVEVRNEIKQRSKDQASLEFIYQYKFNGVEIPMQQSFASLGSAVYQNYMNDEHKDCNAATIQLAALKFYDPAKDFLDKIYTVITLCDQHRHRNDKKNGNGTSKVNPNTLRRP